jgi:glucose-6-phosphate isomerase
MQLLPLLLLLVLQVKLFSERLRAGKEHGVTGKLFRNIVAVGIGGSYLGPEFVHEVSPVQPCARV